MAAIVRERPDMEVVEENDYVHHSKPSGYQSYHLVVHYVVTTIHGPPEPCRWRSRSEPWP